VKGKEELSEGASNSVAGDVSLTDIDAIASFCNAAWFETVPLRIRNAGGGNVKATANVSLPS
jgi:hypothetical protein